jgi:uncharacterized protein (TIGR01777 family)
MKKVIITGATGLIGRNLVKDLLKSNYKVTAIVRDENKSKKILPSEVEFVNWDFNSADMIKGFLENSFSIIHLAGAGVFAKRWNKSYKEKIYSSRVASTKLLVEIISQLNNKPESLIVASGVGYYGNRGDEILSEDSKPGEDFLAKVCIDWEKEASSVQQFGVRWVSVRTGIVLSLEDGALRKMLLPFKFFLGGALGSGKQFFPWIHIKDITAIYQFAIENYNCTGAINAAAPQIITMKDFASELGRVLNRPSFFIVPQLVLKILLGEAASDIISSQQISVEKLVKIGYKFKFPFLKDALNNLLNPDLSSEKIFN